VSRGPIAAVASEPAVTYQTAITPPASATVTVSGTTHTIAGDWVHFFESSSEVDKIDLGDEASFRILHASRRPHASAKARRQRVSSR
jgi:hypothetical protein